MRRVGPVVATEVLKRAAVEVDLRGHWRGAYRGPDGQVSVEAAFELAELHVGDRLGRRIGDAGEDARRALMRHLGLSGFPWTALIDWNDSLDRSAAGVTIALRAAATAYWEMPTSFVLARWRYAS